MMNCCARVIASAILLLISSAALPHAATPPGKEKKPMPSNEREVADSTSASRQNLTAGACKKAVDFVRVNARPLDRAWLEYVLGRGDARSVVAELAKFQNADGGFARLEPDLRTPVSSPMSTAVALQYLRMVNADKRDHVVVRAMEYLKSSFNAKESAWPTVGRETNDSPHAPWWEFDPKTGKTQAGSPFNPTAELAGGMLRFSADHPAWLDPLVDSLIARLQAAPAKMDMGDLISFLHFYEDLPKAKQEAISKKLQEIAMTIVERDTKEWTGYAVKPLFIAPFPSSPLAGVLKDDLRVNLAWELSQQQADGSWAPNWSWFGSYPEEWKKAELEWKGFLTVRMLKTLSEYGRIQDCPEFAASKAAAFRKAR